MRAAGPRRSPKNDMSFTLTTLFQNRHAINCASALSFARVDSRVVVRTPSGAKVRGYLGRWAPPDIPDPLGGGPLWTSAGSILVIVAAFWTLLLSSHVESVNSCGDEASGNPILINVVAFWTLL